MNEAASLAPPAPACAGLSETEAQRLERHRQRLLHALQALDRRALHTAKQAVNYARDHSVEDSLRQMGWLQGAIWSNRHVMESVTAMKQKRAGEFPALTPLIRFSEQG